MRRLSPAPVALWLLVFVVLSTAASVLYAESVAEPVSVAATDWPWWRGPNGNGVAAADQRPPLKWSQNKNILWKSPVEGRGHGSPTVVGDRVFLATADVERQVQVVICYDRLTGKRRWRHVVHRGGLVSQRNKKATLASSTPGCDGQRVFINFINSDAVYTTALTLDGKQLWQTKISDYVVHQGYGSSPAIHGRLVIVSADNKGGGAIAALDRASGAVVWKKERPKTPNYASPIILNVAGKEQLLMTGCDLVSSFDPSSGNQLWQIEGATTECVTSTVTDGELIFTSGGYPKNHIAAVRADGSGEVVWENNTRIYVPSMLVADDHLYCVADAGVAMCWKCATGEKMWQGRLGGTFSASPILVAGRIYVTNESGRTFVFKATPKAFEPLAENQLGDSAMATPAFCGSRIYMRVTQQIEGRRQETLYCLGQER